MTYGYLYISIEEKAQNSDVRIVIWMLDMCNSSFGFARENNSLSIKDQKFIMNDTLIFDSQNNQSF